MPRHVALVWTLASAVGAGIGSSLDIPLVPPLGADTYPGTVTLPSVVMLTGTSVAVGQWLLLRSWFPRANWWVVATLAGLLVSLMAVGLLLVVLLGLSSLPAIRAFAWYRIEAVIAVSGLLGGVVIGSCQEWIVATSTRRRGWWAAASGVGVATFCLIYAAVDSLGIVVADRLAGGLVIGAMCAATYGAVTGAALQPISRSARRR